ncbi:hypothetical protein D3C81_1495390 [compost metagenome]
MTSASRLSWRSKPTSFSSKATSSKSDTLAAFEMMQFGTDSRPYLTWASRTARKMSSSDVVSSEYCAYGDVSRRGDSSSASSRLMRCSSSRSR